MYHDAFLYTWGPSLINVIIVVLRTKSSFPPKKELYGLTVNIQQSITLDTLKAQHLPHLLIHPPRSAVASGHVCCQVVLFLLVFNKPLGPRLLPRLSPHHIAALHFKRLISLAILHKTMSISMFARW